MIANPQFEYYYGEPERLPPTSWASENAYINRDQSVMGLFHVKLTDGYLRQLVPSTSEPSCFSFYAQGVGTLTVKAEFFTKAHKPMGLVHTLDVVLRDTWTRHYVVFGATEDLRSNEIPVIRYPVQGHGFFEVPDGVGYVMLEVSAEDARVDAFQYEHDVRPSMYHRRMYGVTATVEYETSSEDTFQDKRRAVSPTRSLINQAFLYIPDTPASYYGGPPDATITTLNEYKWPGGRIDYIPWARTSGKDKLRFRPGLRFNHIPDPSPEVTNPIGDLLYPAEIFMNPDPVLARAGDDYGAGIVFQCVDQYGNPYTAAQVTVQIFDARQEFPGWLSKRVLGVKEQLGPTVYGRLDDAGQIYVSWIPPQEEHVFVARDTPTPSAASVGTGGERLSSIRVPYPVNLDFHGNVTLRTSTGRYLKTRGDTPVQQQVAPSYAGNFSRIQLAYPAVPGSLRVTVDGTEYLETVVNDPAPGQFFVDYDSGQISVRGRHEFVDVEYIPNYYFIPTSDPNQIVFYHDLVFGDYNGKLIVGYDFSMSVLVEVLLPDQQSFFSKRFEMIAQNPDTRVFNEIALEI